MVHLALIGLGAGAASALLMATMASRSPFSLMLVLLAPLPIMIAALGWSHWTALFAVVVATAALTAAFGEPLWIPIYLIGAGLPAWWLGYLVLLARGNEDGGVEWYPAGRLAIWCTIIGSAIVAIVMWNVRVDEQQFQAALKLTLERMATEYGKSGPDFSKMDVKRTSELIISFVPPLAAAMITAAYMFNLYIAGRVAMVSGRLKRSWPNLAALRFPRHTATAFAIALLVWFMPGTVGMVGGIVSGALIVAYAMLGLAILHSVTRPLGDRVFILSAVYLLLFVFWPACVLLAIFGVSDSIFDFRKTASGNQPPTVT
jgi:hypothetical protein